MTRFPKICLTLLSIGLCLTPYSLEADIAPLQASGGNVAARSPHRTIRMDAEDVTIRLDVSSYTVDAVFRMVNTGETTTEWVGFPRGYEPSGGESSKYPDFSRFHAWVDGKQVEFSKEGDRWQAGKVTFPGHATTTIRVVYEAGYYRDYIATYIVGTGSYWKDSIGRASFTVDGSALGGSKHFRAVLDASNRRRLLTDQALRIEVKDYEPKPDAVLSIGLRSR